MKLRRGTAEAPLVEIIDLPDRHAESYFVCLEDWSAEMKEAGDHKARWYEEMKDDGLRVKVAVTADDRAVGMIQYLPIEQAPAVGAGLYMILCIWVHGYDKGVSDVQGGGIGTRLLAAAEEDARSLGAKGMAAWGLHFPVWMKSSWYKKHGYRQADRAGARDLVWKPFASDAEPPTWLDPKPVGAGPDGTVNVVAFRNGWCPAANLVYERARRAAEELGTEVHFVTIDTTDRDTMLCHGRTDEVLVDGKPLQRGAPPSYRAVRRKMSRRLKKVRRGG